MILDDLERLLDYSAIGPRFSNNMLQTLMVLIKKIPPKRGRRLLIIGTTSEPTFTQESGLLQAFQIAYHSPAVKSGDALMKCLKLASGVKMTPDQAASLVNNIYPPQAATTPKLPVKKVFQALEMASELCKGSSVDARTMQRCLRDFGVAGI